MLARAITIFSLSLLAASCEENRLLQAAHEENSDWSIYDLRKIDNTSIYLKFSNPNIGIGDAYVTTMDWPSADLQEYEARDTFYIWAICFIDGAALDYEIRDMGWVGEGESEVQDYCRRMQSRVRVQWHGQ